MTIDGASDEFAVIDTHQHLLDLDRFDLRWVRGNPKLERSFLLEDYRAASAGVPVVKTVYLEVDVPVGQQVAEAEWIVDLCRDPASRIGGAVISGRPESSDFESYLERFRGVEEIKGMRRLLQTAETPPDHCLTDAFVRGVRLVGAAGWSFDLCMRSPDLSYGADLAARLPDMQFVIDHCGNPDPLAEDLDPWRRGIDLLAAQPNVACKVSGFIANARGGEWTVAHLARVVDHVLDAFGPDRVLFGSDWPVCNLTASWRGWFDSLWQIVRERDPELHRKLFRGNAERVYRLV